MNKIFKFFSPFTPGRHFALPKGLVLDAEHDRAGAPQQWSLSVIWLVVIGGFCWAGERAGRKYAYPFTLDLVRKMSASDFKQVLGGTAGAIFSSLNLLSCISILMMLLTLYRIRGQWDLNEGSNTKKGIPPSRLFIAIAKPYLVLAAVCLLFIYLDAKRSPFSYFPFKPSLNPYDDKEMTERPWVLYWAILKEFSIALFCAFNVLMDLAIAFWIFLRVRRAYVAIPLALFIIGLLEPVVIVWDDFLIDRYAPLFDYLNPYTRMNIVDTGHYLGNVLASCLIAWLLLRNLNSRWRRLARVDHKPDTLPSAPHQSLTMSIQSHSEPRPNGSL